MSPVKNPSWELRLDWRPTKMLPFARYECDETAPVCQSIARITTGPDAKLRLSSTVSPGFTGPLKGFSPPPPLDGSKETPVLSKTSKFIRKPGLKPPRVYGQL